MSLYNAFVDKTILEKIKDFDVRIEIIGSWIYVSDCGNKKIFNYLDKLRSLGFWFSKKHKSWIYSGGKKNFRKTRLNKIEIEEKFGLIEVK